MKKYAKYEHELFQLYFVPPKIYENAYPCVNNVSSIFVHSPLISLKNSMNKYHLYKSLLYFTDNKSLRVNRKSFFYFLYYILSYQSILYSKIKF